MRLKSSDKYKITDSCDIFCIPTPVVIMALMWIFISVPLTAEADEIHMKNGRIIQTPSFWEENDEIIFEKYGNTIRVSRKLVREIRTSHFESSKIDISELFWHDPVTGMKFKWIPAGCFKKSAIKSEGSDAVCLSGFWMGVFEVTNAQYKMFDPAHTNGSFASRYSMDEDRQPAVYISGEDAQAFTHWLTSENNGKYRFRLPMETEWEYACRAGSDAAYFWGNDADQACNYGNMKDSAWKKISPAASDAEFFNCYDGFISTSPVGSFEPNGFGLHDTIGNASEWCQDSNVARGSAFDTKPNQTIDDQRYAEAFNSSNHWTGFRLVMSKKKSGRFELVDRHNEYGGKTQRVWNPRRDDRYEKGVQDIYYFYSDAGKLEKRELRFNSEYAAAEGIYRKIIYADKNEIILTDASATEKGFKRIILYSRIDRRLQMRLEDMGGPE